MVNCEGWTCPACRRNYAPWMPSCNCINSAVGVSATSITITPHADDTAELVTALEALLEDHLAVLEHYASVPGRNHTAIRARAAAALARVKGGELGEGWGEPYAHRDPGKGRPARTARNTRGER